MAKVTIRPNSEFDDNERVIRSNRIRNLREQLEKN
jgi:hypothetical protein